MHLFLDLEDTIITPVTNGWFNVDLINFDKINNFIKSNDVESINIFSFAIHNERELNLFNKHTRNWLEDCLKTKFKIVPTVDEDILVACCKQKNIAPSTIDFSDMSDFWSKDLAFILCIKEWFKEQKNQNFVLLDDAVENCSFTWNKNNHSLNYLVLKNEDSCFIGNSPRLLG